MKPKLNSYFFNLKRHVTSCALLIVLSLQTVVAQEVKQLTLPAAIDLGLQNSKLLKLSQARIDQAVAQYQQTLDSRLPTGSVSYTYNHAEIPTNTFQAAKGAEPLYLPKRAEAFIGTAALQEIIFAGNKLKYAKESTELLTQVARLDAEKDKEDIIYNITSAYFNLYKLQQSQKVIAQNLEAVDRQIKQSQRFLEQGIVTRNDVLRFQLQRSNVELNGADLETNRKVVVYNLNIMLGLPESSDVIVAELQTPNGQATPVTTYQETALDNRLEIKTLELQGRAADNNIKSVRANTLPTVLLGANMYYINPSGAFVPPANSYLLPFTAGATVAWNFDNLWLNKNRVDEAKIQRQQLNISRDLRTDQIKTEVNQTYQNYVQAQNRIRILQTAVTQAQENDKMMESRYTNNVATATERVDAQTQLYAALVNMELARADAGLAYYTLLKSTGTLNQK